MAEPKPQCKFEESELLLANAKLHFKLVFGLTTTTPDINYLGTFTWGKHTATHEELALTPEQEEYAFSALEHCGIYLAVVQIHTALEAIHPDPFSISEPEVSDAFQIARLIRNAFAHNPFNPEWRIGTTWRHRTFHVEDIISLDTSALDGQQVRREHYGGPIAVLRFIEYARKVVAMRAQQPA